MKINYSKKYQRGDFVFDKETQEYVRVVRIEFHDRLKVKWYVVRYDNGMVANRFEHELKWYKVA